MSQTASPTVAPVDDYLMAQVAPVQDIVLDPKYGSIRMVTPVGRLAFTTLDKPKSIKQADGSLGPEQYSCTLLLNPASCSAIYHAICAVANNRWPYEDRPDPQNPQAMKRYTGAELLFLNTREGGLHYPLREGRENYMRNPQLYSAWNGLFFINSSILAVSATGQPQRPVCKDESGRDIIATPDKLYSGCYGRMQITIFAFPKPGSQGRARGVGISLNAVQFARHGEKFTSFDASKAAENAFAAAGALPPADPSMAPGNQIGYGPNTAGPGSVPPGSTVQGFAAPPAPQPMQPVQQPGFAAPAPQPAMQPAAVPGNPIPPQQPQQTYGGGARPPGM